MSLQSLFERADAYEVTVVEITDALQSVRNDR